MLYPAYLPIDAPNIPEGIRTIHGRFQIGWSPAKDPQHRTLSLLDGKTGAILAEEEVSIDSIGKQGRKFRLRDSRGYEGVEVQVHQSQLPGSTAS